MFLYIRVAIGYIVTFFTKVYNYVIKGRYMPDTEYNRQLFDYYLRVMIDRDTAAETPAEVWQDMKIKQSCDDLKFEYKEEDWPAVRQAIYGSAALEMLKLFWIKEDNI